MIPRLADTPVLETDRLILRAPEAGDWEAAAAFITSKRTRYMWDPCSRHDAWLNFGHLVGHWVLRGYGLFVMCLKSGGRPIGDIGPLFPEGWAEPEIGWGIWQDEYEGKGLAFEAAQVARAYVFRNLGWKTAVSYVDPENARSIALAERLGCRLDPEADLPDLPGWEGTLVYRHTRPEAH